MRGRAAVLLAVLVPLVAAARAEAVTRYATPAGSPTDPTCAAATPCTLQRGVAVGQAGDDVLLAPGDYAVGADPFCGGALATDKLYIHGTPGLPRPRIIGPPSACVAVQLTYEAALSDVEVDGNGGGHALTVDLHARAFRVVTGGTNGTVWVQRGGLLANSVARAGTAVDAIASYNGLSTDNSSVVNDTAIGRVSVVADTGDMDYLYVNNTVATGAFHVYCDNSGALGHMRLSYARGSAQIQDGNGSCSTFDADHVTVGGDPGLRAGDWHSVPGGPLQDAGSNGLIVLNDPAFLSDIDGGSRPLGASVDIGADEVGSSRPVVDSGGVTSLSGSTAVVTGSVDPLGVPTAVYADYGPTAAYGLRSSAVGLGAAFGAAPVSLTLTGLTANGPYHYRLVATNGSVVGEDRVIAFPDADHDGWFANVDCNDANAAINPGAKEIVGNAVDENCDGRVAPYPSLGAGVTISVLFYKPDLTKVTKLYVGPLPAGTTVALTCTSPKRASTASRCPFKRKTVAVRKATRRAQLAKYFKRRKLALKTRFEVRVTKPATIGLVARFTTRKLKIPRRQLLCLPPDAENPRKC